MAYQLSKTGAQINAKLQELTVRTLTADGNTASTDGIILLDNTSADITLSLRDADFVVGQRLIVVVLGYVGTHFARITGAASETIQGQSWSDMLSDYAWGNYTTTQAYQQGALVELVKIATNTFQVIRNFKFGGL